jgi:hypothetical protein
MKRKILPLIGSTKVKPPGEEISPPPPAPLSDCVLAIGLELQDQLQDHCRHEAGSDYPNKKMLNQAFPSEHVPTDGIVGELEEEASSEPSLHTNK